MANNYEELVRLLQNNHHPNGLKAKAADAIEELQRHYCRHAIHNEHDRGDDSLCGKYNCEVNALPHWIPVTERLPEKDGKYLCNIIRFGQYIWKQYCYIDVLAFQDDCFFEDDIGIERVTHWMPIPQPPKVDHCADCVHYPPSSTDGKPCCACDPANPLTNCHETKEET